MKREVEVVVISDVHLGTTSQAVMRINTQLGYVPTTFSDLPQDESFWKQCISCPNYDILLRTARKMCLCTAMIAAATRDL